MRIWIGPWEWETAMAPARWRPPVGSVAAIDLRPMSAQSTRSVASGAGLFVTPDAVALSAGYREIPASLGPAARSAISTALQVENVTATTRAQLIADLLTTHASPDGSTFARPLMPNRRGRLVLAIGDAVFGHQLDPSSPHWAKIQAVYQAIYREHRQRVLDGTAPPQFHRKWLGHVLQALPAFDYRLFIPADVPSEVPLAPSTTLTESFNTADSTTLGPTQSWTEFSGSGTGDMWEVAGNQVVCKGGASNTPTARAEADVSGTDHYAQVSVTTLAAANSQLGPAARFSASEVTCYIARLVPAAGSGHEFGLIKLIAGTQTDLVDTGQSISLPHTVKVECNGSTIKGYIGGVEKLSTTDTSITTGTRGGLFGYNSGQNTTDATGDSWTLEDLAGGGGTAVPVFVHQLITQGMA